MQTMKSGGAPRRDEKQVSEGGGEQVTNNLVALGDVMFIRLRGGSWWPAQVVDENTVNKSIKPAKRSAGKVLVRLYGSYKYLYADPIKFRSEFEMILKQNNGSYKKILQQALEQDLPHLKFSGCKDSELKTKANVRIDASTNKKPNENKGDDGQETEELNDSSGFHGRSPSASVKKTRVLKSNIKARSRKGITLKSDKDDGSQRKLRQSNSAIKEANSKTLKGNVKAKIPDVNGMSSEGKQRRNGQQVKAKPLSPSSEKKMKRNQNETRVKVKKGITTAKKQDKVQKDLELLKKRPKSKSDEVQDKAKQLKQSSSTENMRYSPKQNEVLNEDDLSCQNLEMTQLVKSQELSARRIRVMESLGLIAPPGSPFHKDRLTRI